MIQRDQLNQIVNEQNLTLIGVVALGEKDDSYSRYRDWLQEGYHAGMDYLERNQDLREDPTKLLESLGNEPVFAVVLGAYYRLNKSRPKTSAQIAQYARFADYHRWLRKKTERVAEFISNQSADCQQRVVVDTAPILERSVAEKTPSGFVGKNTCFITPKRGSFLLLSEIVTTAPLEADRPQLVDPKRRSPEGGCGPCKRCQVHCPTGALDKDYVLDARKCLSYWTIENRGTIPEEFWPHLKEYFFGCDICQWVCPYNRSAEIVTPAVEPKLRETLDLFEVATMNQTSYERTFGGTAMTRAKRNGLRRNALIAMKVLLDPRLEQALASVDSDGCEMLHATKQQILAYPVQ